MSHIKQRKHSVSRNKLATGVGLGTALLAGMVASTASAAETTNAVTLPEVSVNAKKPTPVVGSYQQDSLQSPKFTQPVSEMTRTVQVISEDIIDDQHATTLTEALRNSPGVGAFHMGENGGSKTGDAIFMRGTEVSGSIFVDGVRDMGAVSRDTFNIEQINVIKGASGTDHGRTSAGGSINLVTKKAHQGNDGSLSVSGGTEGEKRVTFDINRQLSDSIAARLNLMWEDSDVPGRDIVENERWGVAPAVTFGLGTDKRLHINYLHVQQNNVPDGGVYTIGFPNFSNPLTNPANPDINIPMADAPKVDSENFYGTSSDFEDVSIDRATIAFEHDIDASTSFHNTLRWSQIELAYIRSAPFANHRYTGGFTFPVTLKLHNTADRSQWEISTLLQANDQTNSIVTNQAGIVEKFATGGVDHTLSYGLELSRETAETTGVDATAPALAGGLRFVNMYNPAQDRSLYVYLKENGQNSEGTVDTASVYLFDTLDIGSQWQLNGGVRFSQYSLEVDSGSSFTADSESLFTWQLGTLYRLADNGNVYVNYAVSAQPPGGESLSFSNRSSSEAKPGLDPTQSKTAEVGTKWSFANDRLLLTAAIYQTKIENLLQEDPTSGQYFQIGERTIKGGELGIVGQITRNWNISAGYMTLDTEDVNGKPITFTPDSAFTSWSTYRLPFGLVIGGGVRFVGDRERTTRTGQHTPTFADAYVVGDAMLSYPVSKHLGVQLNVYNLTDEEYAASINRSGMRYTPGTPRSAVLSVNYDF